MSAYILTHAHNPWGFANALRCTEENVDLNRNFIDFEKPLPSNPNYPLVHEAIARTRWDVSDMTDDIRASSTICCVRRSANKVIPMP